MEKKIIRIGQASIPGSQAGTVYSGGGIAPTLSAGCHGYAMGYVVRKYGKHQGNRGSIRLSMGQTVSSAAQSN